MVEAPAVAARPSVLYISMLGEETSEEMAKCASSAEGADDSRWLVGRLQELGASELVDLTSLNIAGGDSLPDAGRFDFTILGGTFHGVYDARPWQLRLQSWLEAHRKTQKPLLGICGGHQAMAAVLGGDEVAVAGDSGGGRHVACRPGGKALGTIPVALTEAGVRHALFAGLGDTPAFHFANGDEVVKPPPGSTVLASTADSPAVALDYGGGWQSTQFHPEASYRVFQHLADQGVIGQPPIGLPYRPAPAGRALLANFLRLDRPEVP
mmetsp:Transcript_90955/g.253114  ORF Transcript_90955/g.253114 Transcript_90955/m.253114 type:complete len:267 (+) Transcript_90955:117-917(+)